VLIDLIGRHMLPIDVWESAPDRCCHFRKVVPLKAELAHVDAWITAIRRARL